MSFIKRLGQLRQHPQTDNQRVFRGMLAVSAFVMIGKLAGAGKEIGIAWRFGVGEIVDIYVIAFVIINWAPSVLASALNSVYVPLIRTLPENQRLRFNAVSITGITVACECAG